MSRVFGLNVESPALQSLIADDPPPWLPLLRGFRAVPLEKNKNDPVGSIAAFFDSRAASKTCLSTAGIICRVDSSTDSLGLNLVLNTSSLRG